MSRGKQKTPEGAEIPVPKRSEFMKNLRKLAEQAEDEKPSAPKRRPEK